MAEGWWERSTALVWAEGMGEVNGETALCAASNSRLVVGAKANPDVLEPFPLRFTPSKPRCKACLSAGDGAKASMEEKNWPVGLFDGSSTGTMAGSAERS